jgi:hypothetical protein
MKTNPMMAATLLIAVLSCSACGGQGSTAISSPQSSPAQTNTTGELRFKAPEGWVVEKTSSAMRVAQYKLPKAEGDKEDGSLVLYYFGQSGRRRASQHRSVDRSDATTRRQFIERQSENRNDDRQWVEGDHG